MTLAVAANLGLGATVHTEVRTIRTWAELHALTSEEAAKRTPAHLRLVVTYSPAQEHNLWGQDKTGVGFAYLPKDAGPFPLGELLDVDGVTDPGNFGPCLRIKSYRDLGFKGIPKAVNVPLRRVMSGSEDGRRVFVTGRLVSILLPHRPGGRTSMVLVTDRTRLPVYLYGSSLQTTSTLLDSEVRMVVTPSLKFNTDRQFTGVVLNLTRPEDLTVLIPGSRNIPVTRINDLMKYQPGGISDTRVRVEGVATYYDGSSLLAIQDGSHAVFAQLAEADPIQIGSWLFVLGYPRARPSNPILSDARAYPRAKRVAISPRQITMKDALTGRFDAQLIQIKGDLVDHGYSREYQALTVRSDGVTFVADFPKQSENYVSGLHDGSTIVLTGILHLEMGSVGSAPQSFRVLLRNSSDITVLKGTPWLTRTHLIYIAEVLGALLLCFLIWVSMLRRQVYRQTKKLWEQRRRAAQREESHRVLVENASDLIFTVSAQGTFISANPATARVTGTAADVLSSKRLHDIVIRHETEAFQAWFEELIRNGSGTGEFDIRTASGSVRTLDLSAHVSGTIPDQMHVEFVGRDVTARRRTHSALEQARQAAEAANAAKTRFLANMSHEIRTPLNALLGTAELLSSTELNDDQRSYVATFQHSGNTLLQLLNGILDLTKVESGHLQFETVVFSIETLVTSVVTMMGAPAREKGIRISWTIDPAVPSYVVGDPTKVRQVLTNLVGNAVKFTEFGGVRVEVRRSGIAPNGRALIAFVVKDSGVGIPSEKLDLIFERFTQADGSTTRRFGGTGLGLSISKGLAEAMGGSIAVSSVVGTGSEFILTVPLEVAPLNTKEQAVIADAPSTSELMDALRKRPASILIAEDNEANRIVLEAYLKDLPFAIDWAPNGIRAVELEQQQAYDLILMDIEMPEMDGYEASRRICERRTNNGLPPLRIVALTAHAFDDTRKDVELAGCSELLTKPVRRKTLLAALERNLSRSVQDEAELTSSGA